MLLAAGSRLGPYEIQSLIGAGGMGEVYQARDTRLDRTVAIKVLPAELSNDADRRARFEREARAISSLTHPHICTLYDVGEQDGTTYLVMEHLTGESLAARIARGPLQVAQVLDIGAQIADALAAAHKQGVVHRDLKPANVMLVRAPTGSHESTPGPAPGTGHAGPSFAKLLDFGLAKLRPLDAAQAVTLTTSPATSAPSTTDRWTILGTLPYMAPEQVQGLETDARTDLWALGAILYEMLTGARAFDAPSGVRLVAAILERDPPGIASLSSSAPPALVRLISRCLRKSPDERWESANDVADELRWIGSLGSAEPPSRSAVPWPALAALGLSAFVVGAATVLLSGAWPRHPPQSPRQPVVRSVIELPQDVVISAPRDALGLGRPALALSPDGTSLAFVGQHDRDVELYLRSLDDPDAVAIAGTSGAYSPFFSPDSQWIGFFAGGRLKKVAVRGGAPVVVCEVRNPVGASWMGDGTILIGDQEGTVLARVQGDGGAPVEGSHGLIRGGASWPQVLPDGQHVLARDRDGNTVVVSLRTGERRVIVADATGATYAASGHLLFARDSSLMGAPFDLTTLQLTGPPVRLVPDVRVEPSSLAAQFTVSAGGILAYVRGGPALARLTWVDRTGRTEAVGLGDRAFGNFALSPDGQRLAVEVDEPRPDIWILDVPRGALSRLTTDGVSRNPVWTTDGARVTFYAARPGTPGLYWQPWDGSAPPERLLDLHGRISGSWSPDGRSFMYSRVAADGNFDLWTLRVDGHSRTTSPFLESPFTEWGGAWSPNGRWVAYTSDESGRYEVYVRSARGEGRKWQVSSDGGEEPRWSAAGRELVFRNGQRWLAAPVSSDGPEFGAEQARVLFEGPYINTPGPSYDVSPAGRFVVLAPAGDEPGTRQVHVVVNWFEELKTKR